MPFQYTPYRNQYVGSITDLMGRGRDAEAQALIDSANAQAQAAQVSGQAWGGAVQSIGNTIAAIPGQIQAGQDRELEIAERAEDRAYLMDERERSNQAIADADRASAIYADRVSGVSDSAAGLIPKMSWLQSPDRVEGPPIGGVEPLQSRQLSPDQHPYQVEQDGGWVFDIEGFRRAAAEAGPGVLEQIEPYVAQMESMNTMRRSVVELGRAEARNQATWLTALPDEGLLQALPAEIRGFKGVIDQGILDSLTGLVEQGDAAGIRSVLNGYIGKPSQFMSVGQGDVIQDVSTMAPGEVVQGQPVARKPIGAPVEVVLNGQKVLVQRYDDGTYDDLTSQGITPTVDDSQESMPSTEWGLIVAASDPAHPRHQQAIDALALKSERDRDRPPTATSILTSEMQMERNFRSEMTSHREIERQFNIMRTGLRSLERKGLELLEFDRMGDDQTIEFGDDGFMIPGGMRHTSANAASQAILVTFQKILDPDSVVRESEYARSAQGVSLMDRIRGEWMRITRGGAGVPVNELKGFVALASQWAAESRASASRIKSMTDDVARRRGLDPRNITGSYNPSWGTTPEDAQDDQGGTVSRVFD
jgi:hypothetical protein